MEKERIDQVVFIKDLLFAALYQWRRIIAVALIFAVMLGGIVGVAQWKSTADVASDEVIQAAIKDYENQKLLLDKVVEDAQRKVDSQEEYSMESTLMALDPYGIYRATVELTVLSDKEIQYETADNAPAILHAYSVYLSSDQVISEIAEEMNMKPKYLTELILMENGGSETKSLSITVHYPTAEGAQTILDALMSALAQAKLEITENLGAHKSSIVASSVDERIDLTIIEKQEEAAQRLEKLQTALVDAQSQRSALNAPSFGTSASIRKVVLFAIIGAILGAGIVACCAWVGHIASNKVYSARVLKNKTGLRVLGCVPSSKKKNAIDRWLRKLEGRALREDSLAIAVATAKNYCDNGESLLVAGCCDQEELTLIALELTKLGIQATAGGCLLQSAAALEQLPLCDKVLLVEKCGCSKYGNILLAAERIADQNKPLIGCILFEG